VLLLFCPLNCLSNGGCKGALLPCPLSLPDTHYFTNSLQLAIKCRLVARVHMCSLSPCVLVLIFASLALPLVVLFVYDCDLYTAIRGAVLIAK
jgi:hypothetical protein